MKGLRRGFSVDVHRRSCFNPLPDAPTGDFSAKPNGSTGHLPPERLLAESKLYGALLHGLSLQIVRRSNLREWITKSPGQSRKDRDDVLQRRPVVVDGSGVTDQESGAGIHGRRPKS